jgi:mannose-6-phosphate isomerase
LEESKVNFYPLKFNDNYKEKIWGGESWALSEHPSALSIISNGDFKGKPLTSLVKQYPKEILGKEVANLYGKLPLLFKFIDAKDKLSIQVHPDDTYAELHENSLGKTEAWYVVHAEKNAKIICGLAKPLTRNEIEENIEKGCLEKVLKEFEVKTGDCFFVPAGTVHAIEAGLRIYEVQEVSDITYRLYDWGRLDDNGKLRELHIEQSLKVMNFNDIESHRTTPISFTEKWGKREILTVCDYFILSKYSIADVNSIKSDGKFKVITLLSGAVDIEYNGGVVNVSQGETVLLPAALLKIILKPAGNDVEALVTEIPLDKNAIKQVLIKSGATEEQLTKLGGLK